MELQNRKLFIFDLDGTLLNSQKQISQENINALLKARQKGHLLAIATGRNTSLAKEVVGKYWKYFHYYLGCNAAIFHNIKEYKHYNSSLKIPFTFATNLIKEVKKIGGGMQISTVWKMYADFYQETTGKIGKLDEKKYFVNHALIETMTEQDRNNIMQLSVYLDENLVKEYHDKWLAEFGDQYDFSITSKNNIDVNIKNINKLYGIKHIAKEEKILFDNVVVFGDSQNDIPGIRYYNNTYAMENGLAETKKVAKHIIGNNNSDAIANVVLKHI